MFSMFQPLDNAISDHHSYTVEISPKMSLALTFAYYGTSLSADLSFSCMDNGLYQRYCPQQSYPYDNSRYVPVRSNLRIKSGELVPRTRRENDDTVGLRFFEYSVVCEGYNLLYECTKGDVTVHVHPTPKWDRPISPCQFVIDIIVALIIVSIGGLILLFFCFLSVKIILNMWTSEYRSSKLSTIDTYLNAQFL